MNFIFPKNYNFKPKLLGFIDYSTAILNIIICLILYGISSILFVKILCKIYFLLIFYFPIFLLSVFCFQKENIFTFIKYTFKFFKNKKIYLYNKKI